MSRHTIGYFTSAALAFAWLTAMPAQADIIVPPPYVGNPCTTHTELQSEPGTDNPHGLFTSTSCGQYVLYDQPPSIVGEPGTWDLFLPNFVDPFPIKDMRIQLTFVAQPTTAPPEIQLSVTAGDNDEPAKVVDLHSSSPQPCTACPGGNLFWWDDFWIFPNPDWERIVLTYDPQGLLLSQWVVDTWSHDVPEPGTLALFGAGLAGLGALRRRRKGK